MIEEPHTPKDPSVKAVSPPADFEEKGSEEELGVLYTALAKARGEFKPVPKNKEGQVGHQKFQYAPLATIEACTTPALTKYGLAVLQPFSVSDGMACIRTILSCGSARLVSRFCFEPHSDLKELGKQSTYYARYAYQRLLCIDSGEDADNDDNMKAPTGAKPQRPAPKQTRKKATVKVSAVEPERVDAGNTAPEHSPIPSEVFTADEPDPEPDLEQSISDKTSTALNTFFVENKFKGPECVEMCQQVTGRTPDELEQPGGEALAAKLLEHARSVVEARSGS